ncbi:protein PAT1 homolog 1 [Pelobates fuscus]|uniref:protein PAT1 homolog 1 n=1 Tax=Pelobates fuscus TaxID=191477 RepID=UPI002FE439D8
MKVKRYHQAPAEVANQRARTERRNVAVGQSERWYGKRRELVRAPGKKEDEDCRRGLTMLRCQSLDDGDGFPDLEEDEDIDQFNDDTFGAGAIDDDWREAHERLAEMEEKLPPSHIFDRASPNLDPLGEQQEELEHSLSQLVKESEEPSLPQGSRTQISPGMNSCIWNSASSLRPIRGPLLTEDMTPLSILHEYGLAPLPPPSHDDLERDASERALPRRSTSPVIGSPPVLAVPIGTPPKHGVGPAFNQQQVLCPNPIHIRASSSHFGSHPSNTASLLRHPFPSALSPLQRAQLLGGAQAAPGRLSPSHFSRATGLHTTSLTSAAPKLLQGHVGQMVAAGGAGFRPFFGVHPPTAPGAHLNNLRPQPQFRPDTTHLHPQHRRLLHQRQQNRNQHRGVNGSSGDRSSRPSHSESRHRDPYAGLMLQREKEWVCRIQLLQLQSTDPYHDDFYYQNYFEKLDKLSASQDKPREGPKKERTKLITPQVAKLEHTYKPVQFEGSLGKLTVSSVNNPRKMIDAVATSRSDEDENREKQVRDKRRQTLVVIEKAFSVVLQLEDFERRFAMTCEEEERLALHEERKQKLQKLSEIFRGREGGEKAAEEQFVQIMCIRKGKRMIARVLPLLSVQSAASLLCTIAHNLPFLIKKDVQDQALLYLAGPCTLVLNQLSPAALASVLQSLCGSAITPPQQQLSSVLQNKFGLALLCQILDRGEELLNSEDSSVFSQSQWTSLIAQIAHCILQIPSPSLSQPPCSPGNALVHFSRYLDAQNLSQLQSKLSSTSSTQ